MPGQQATEAAVQLQALPDVGVQQLLQFAIQLDQILAGPIVRIHLAIGAERQKRRLAPRGIRPAFQLQVDTFRNEQCAIFVVFDEMQLAAFQFAGDIAERRLALFLDRNEAVTFDVAAQRDVARIGRVDDDAALDRLAQDDFEVRTLRLPRVAKMFEDAREVNVLHPKRQRFDRQLRSVERAFLIDRADTPGDGQHAQCRRRGLRSHAHLALFNFDRPPRPAHAQHESDVFEAGLTDVVERIAEAHDALVDRDDEIQFRQRHLPSLAAGQLLQAVVNVERAVRLRPLQNHFGNVAGGVAVDRNVQIAQLAFPSGKERPDVQFAHEVGNLNEV